MRRVVLAATTSLTGIVGFAALALTSGPGAGAQATVSVSIGDNWFCNASFAGSTCDTNVTAGDSVLWTNTGAAPHTVTECGDAFSLCPLLGGFSSLTLNSGQTFSQTFPTAGTYEYFCNIHGNSMQGRILVAAAQATPSPTASPTPGPATTGVSGASPTASRTAGPVTVPGGGGMPGEADPAWGLVLGVAVGALLVVSGSIVLVAMRRR